MSDQMFEKAVRAKLRWPWYGLISLEELYDLRVESLDKIYRSLQHQVREQVEDSLLETKTAEGEILSLQIAIVTHIVEVKLQEAKAAQDAALRATQKQRLLTMLAEKQEGALRGMSEEELLARLAELDAQE